MIAAALTALGLVLVLVVALTGGLVMLGRSIRAEDQVGDLSARPPTRLAGLARHLLGLHVQRPRPASRPGHGESGDHRLAGCVSRQDGREAP